MNCPHCQKELPEGQPLEWCPFCGRDLAPSEADASQHLLPPVKTNWWAFFFALIAPVLLSIFAVLLGANSGNTSPMIAFFGGGAAGVVCGVLLGRQLGRTVVTRFLLGVLFTLIMMVVCIGMSCFGCLASGFQLRFG